jgi:hypothetical protein
MYSKEQLQNIKTQTNVIMVTQKYCHKGVRLNKLWHEIINGLCDQLLSKDFANVIPVSEPTAKDISILVKAYNYLVPHRFNKENEFTIELNDVIEKLKKAQK